MKTHMFDEIMEQPAVVKTILAKYINGNNIFVDLPQNISKLRIVASGSSYNASSIISHFFNDYTDLDMGCEYSAEFILKSGFKADKNALYMFISQSGETSDTCAALKKVKDAGVATMAITNKENSTLWNEADYKMYLYAGEEKSIAATKSFSAQVLCLYLVFLKYLQRNNPSLAETKLKELSSLAADMEAFLVNQDSMKKAAKILSGYKSAIALGSNIFYSVALEAALKIKETSYVNVNAYRTGEFLHGHMAVLNEKAAVIAFVDDDNVEIETGNLKKLFKDYDPALITVSDSVDDDKFELNFRLNKMPLFNKIMSLLLFLQTVACFNALELGRDIDNPKGLSKVVKA